MSALLEHDGHVAVVTLDNPPLNIIDEPTRRDLHRILDNLESTDDLRAVAITGQGERSFCAGADMQEESELTPDTVRQFQADDNGVYDRFENLPVPVVAAINGHCMGGGFELALAADIRVAATSAKFCAAGVKIGLVVSTTRLVRLVGLAAAKDVVLTGRTFIGSEARELGIVTRIEPVSEVRSAGIAIAQEIASRAPLAVRRAKQSLVEATALSFDEGLAEELEHFVALSSTRDHKHALDAFFRRVQPEFEGR